MSPDSFRNARGNPGNHGSIGSKPKFPKTIGNSNGPRFRTKSDRFINTAIPLRLTFSFSAIVGLSLSVQLYVS